jgi:thioredoxin reductase/Pyruvate/2-oxoacid:ferredoxin oxidoreductase delta subunit
MRAVRSRRRLEALRFDAGAPAQRRDAWTAGRRRMSWTLLIGLVLALVLATIVALFRQGELRRLEQRRRELTLARERGTHRARLQVPHVDLSRCLGCGACIRACPEEGVLALIHGQALVVHGARCVGHGACARECPTGAIALTIGELETRRDIPALAPTLEVPGVPGLFLGGEVTGYALIRTAVGHGTAIAGEVARRVALGGAGQRGAWDLCIVGAGPAGFAMALEAKARGLSFLVLEQDALGGTVAKYPRQKLVMTQPLELPLVGRLARTTYSKEELLELWQRVAEEQALPIHAGVRFLGLEPRPGGGFVVATDRGQLAARHVGLTLGRRGSPRRLGIPGEELGKVAYGLIDARAHQERRVLVVGGGDSAVEAALALAEQPGNEVLLSYRQPAFSRLRARNEERIAQAEADGTVRVLFRSTVARIEPEFVELRLETPAGPRRARLPNDEVFVLIGGEPPFPLLGRCGVSFDPADRPVASVPVERGTGLLRALALALALSLVGLGWITRHSRYYTLPAALRPFAEEHEWLRPSSAFGLTLGTLGAGMILANLAYLARRHGWLGLRLGSLRAWMTMHVLTGVLALLFGVLHGGMSTQDTLGHRALFALAVVVVTGTLGRYVYAFVPRATNGRELELDEIKAELAAQASEWDREHREFGERLRTEVHGLLARLEDAATVRGRLWAFSSGPFRLGATLRRLGSEGRERGLLPAQVERLCALARRAYRTAAVTAHLEELRALLSSWRYLHRWIALFLVLVVALHVLVALRYGSLA